MVRAAFVELLTCLSEPPEFADTDQKDDDMCLVTLAKCHHATAAMLHAPGPLHLSNLYTHWPEDLWKPRVVR